MPTRHRNQENLKILVGNFQEIEKNLTEKYDYITLIGVFEYGEAYIQSEDPYVDFLKIISRHLKPDGKIILLLRTVWPEILGRMHQKIISEFSSRGWKAILGQMVSRLLQEKNFVRS